jgi:hypothetical protein
VGPFAHSASRARVAVVTDDFRLEERC